MIYLKCKDMTSYHNRVVVMLQANSVTGLIRKIIFVWYVPQFLGHHLVQQGKE